jgi:predicted HTH transcriptional regulator
MSIHSYIHTNISRYILLDIIIYIRRDIVMKIHSKKILELIKRKRIVTSSEVAEFFRVSWNTAEKYLMELALEGRVERIKKAGVNLWLLR